MTPEQIEAIHKTLTDVRVYSEKINGSLEKMELGQAHAEGDIEELKSDLKTFKEQIWLQVNTTKETLNTEITNLKLGAMAVTVKLGMWPKIMVSISVILSIIGFLISMFGGGAK